MKDNKLLILVLLAMTTLVFGYTRDWTESTPTDSTVANQIDDYNRYLRVDMSDRLKNMIYGFTAGETTEGFKYLQFYEQASIATPSAGYGRLGCKAVTGKCELHWKDEDGDEIQLTTGGKWNGAVLSNDSVDSAHYAAGSIDAEHLAADIIDETKIADNGIDSEHYNDGSVDEAHLSNALCGLSGSTDSTGELTVGDLVLKWGKKTLTASGDTAVDFTDESLTDFSNACFQVFVCYGQTSAGSYAVSAHTLATSGFTINNGSGEASLVGRWFAIGY